MKLLKLLIFGKPKGEGLETYSVAFVHLNTFVAFYKVTVKLCRTGKVAEMLGVNRVAVIRWIKQGKIKAVRIGKEFRIPEDEVKRLLKGKVTNTAVIYARNV